MVDLCILASTTALAISNNFIGNPSQLRTILNTLDIIINVIFSLELVVKVDLPPCLLMIVSLANRCENAKFAGHRAADKIPLYPPYSLATDMLKDYSQSLLCSVRACHSGV
jgi:hypothetical protein